MIVDQLTNTICLTNELQTKFNYLWQLVGNTPMLEIQCIYKDKPRRVFVKCEQYNLTGSIKDRMALYTLHQSYNNCLIKPKDIIIEATSGNTGIAFSAIGRILGHEVEIIMPNWLSKERKDIIKSLGANIRLVSKEEGGFLGSIAMAESAYNSRENVFLPRQFENEFNIEAHEVTTGAEILQQLENHGLVPDAFVAGVGTGGTVMGIGKKLKSLNPSIKVHPLEPYESPTLSTGFKVGSHRIQGISDEFIPSIVKLSALDPVLKAKDGDAIIVAQQIASSLGLGVGISSGANFIGALQLLEDLGNDAIVVTIFPDCNKKYLSTDLMKAEPKEMDYFSNHLKFTGFKSMGRLSASADSHKNVF
ncbi:cysteine synthase family protein [Belliella sp. DSM 111904]|uniref:Cysteine synthase family protein n=1 Tax=Belliella filtrata TaxID=2923435 RepID=A0ABS9UYA3_9BACT|nr:cysteine synthase family protein [Belliella filtrata]MCH7408924.1 cysteine synthase family protein [Belliella filtrata]